jgi:hypothetical protein
VEDVRPFNNITTMRDFLKLLAILLVAKIFLGIIIILFVINAIR